MNNTPQTPEKSTKFTLSSWVNAHALFTFFFLTFLFTFGAWAISMLSGVLSIFDLGLWGPALAAMITTAITAGTQGVKELFQRLFRWRVPFKWYLIIFLGWPLLSILATLLTAQITNQPLNFNGNNWSRFQIWLISALVLGFWSCEEIGWRGFALPRLLKRWNALSSSIVLGILWAVWHLPYYLGTNGIHPDFYTLPIFTISFSILMTWVFNHTQESIFVATFFHFWVNIYSGFQSAILPIADQRTHTIAQYLLLAGAAIAVVIIYGYRNLTRKRKETLPLADTQ